MTFTDALLGLLVIAILLVAADALRRMWADRRNLRIKIDTRFKDFPEETNTELLGTARPAKAADGSPVGDEAPTGQAPEASANTPPAAPKGDVRQPALHKRVVPATDKQAPPAASTEPEPEAAAAAKKSVARKLLGGGKPAAKKPAKSEPVAAEEVLVVHLLMPAGVSGEALLQALLQQGLRYGDMKIFHLYAKGECLFSMANALQPGYFNIDAMETDTFKAVTFFVTLPGPSEPLLALDCMLTCAKYLAHNFDGELRDENRVPLSAQMIEHLRERVREFERRMRVKHGR